MRVCLINPPRIHPKSWGKPSVLQPWDLAYVAALLEKRHTVHIIDAPSEGWKNLEEIDSTKYRFGLGIKEITARIKSWAPDLVVISAPFLGWWKTVSDIASAAKSIDKNIITVLMGADPSVRPEDCLKKPNIDFVVIGEPEQTILELVDTIEKGKLKNLKKVNGIAFNQNEKIIVTPARPFIEDLDSLPFPARNLLPMSTYFAAVKENPLRGEINKPWVAIITSRGCPHNCIFCSNHIIMGRKWRARSPENVVDEIEQLVKTYHIKQIDFEDANLTVDKKRLEKICDLIIEKGLDIEWYTPNGVRADGLDEDILKKMAASGCKKIRIAPESGVQRVVDQIIRKNLDLKKVEKTVISARKVGIGVGCFFIIGFIGETKQDIKATIDYAHRLRKLGADRFYFSYATPLYGTELYEQAKRGGFLRPCFNEETLAAVEPLIETPDFNADDIRKLCAEAYSVNSTFSHDKITKAMRHPKKTIKKLLEREKSRRRKRLC
jgi:anaerobic magnesium-protoporphyrin IX monomethyl ester cyclase